MPPDADRLAALERAVADLARDVTALRAELRAEQQQAAPPAGSHATARPIAAPAPPAAPTYGSVFGTGPAPRPADGAPGLLDRGAAYARRQATGLGLPERGAAGPDVEALVGRYGTVAVAALLILMGVGAFLTWAVARVTVTPAVRVALGVVLAALLAGTGWWLRRRAARDATADPDAGVGGRRFGDLLFGIALAVVHVDAWAAGPSLGLVPPAAALAAAAAASAALAALAWRAGQQALFVVGVGGALVAPFVTGAGQGRPLVLAAYGWLVLAAGMLALPNDAPVDQRAPDAPRPRRWRAAAALLALGGAVYTGVLLDDATPAAAVGNPAGLFLPAWTLRRDAPALFALACALTALAAAAPRRRTAGTLGALALSFVVCTFGALASLGLAQPGGALDLTAVAFAALLATHAALPLLGEAAGAPLARGWWTPGAPLPAVLVALALPLLLLAAALVTLDEAVGAAGAGVAGVWAAVSGAAAWQTTARAGLGAPVRLAAAHVAAAGLASALVPLLAFPGRDVLRVTLLAAHAAAAAQLLPRVRHALTLLAPATVVCVAAAWAGVLLDDRPAYAYTPFLTPASLAAALTAAAAGVVAWRAWSDGRDAAAAGQPAPGEPALRPGERAAAAAAAVGVALLWGRAELARAVSPDVSTFLLIGYFAAAGVAGIALGRARGARAARQAGLALALYAAFKAFAQASALAAVGLKVASYLLVGGFLLGVGYWYRAAGSRLGSEEPA